MPKDTKTLGNNKARACESLGFVHKKRLCQRFDTTSYFYRFSGIILPESYQYDFDGVPPQTVLRRTLSISCPPPQC